MLDVSKQENFETSLGEDNVEIKSDRLQEAATIASDVPISQIQQPSEIVPIQKIKKVKYILINYCYKKFNIEYIISFRTLCLNQKRLLVLDEKYVYFVFLFNY